MVFPEHVPNVSRIHSSVISNALENFKFMACQWYSNWIRQQLKRKLVVENNHTLVLLTVSTSVLSKEFCTGPQHLFLVCFVLHCVVLYCIVLYCIALHCIALYCTTSHRIALYNVSSSPWPCSHAAQPQAVCSNKTWRDWICVQVSNTYYTICILLRRRHLAESPQMSGWHIRDNLKYNLKIWVPC